MKNKKRQREESYEPQTHVGISNVDIQPSNSNGGDREPRQRANFDTEEANLKSEDWNHVDINMPSPKILKPSYNEDALYEQPTSEELHMLKETSTLFHSALFRLQIQEMLNEVKVKPKKSWSEWIEQLIAFLSSLPDDGDSILVKKERLQRAGFEIPIFKPGPLTEGDNCFMTPTSVKVIGGYSIGLVLKRRLIIDLAVKMPTKYFNHSDILNHTYHTMRALYLLCLAEHLQKCEWISSLNYTYFHGDYLKPVLLVRPGGKMSNKFAVYIYPYVQEDTFELISLAPSRNNVETSWAMEGSVENEDVPTPRYNCSILTDLLLERNNEFIRDGIAGMDNIIDALILLQVWMEHRQLGKGFGGFSPFIQKMYVLYLLQHRKLNNLMSSYQIVRSVLLNLATRSWIENGITLDQSSECEKTLKNFKALFEVLFIDPSGVLNLTANMSLATLELIRYEAEMAVSCLDYKDNCFDCLFLLSTPFVSRFDHLIHIDDCPHLTSACHKLNIGSSLIDIGSPALVVLPNIIDYLRLGLDERIRLIGVHLKEPPIWSVSDKLPNADYMRSLLIGLLLDNCNSKSIMIKGPFADTSDALKFREFWGELSEFRHFPDGTICEAVVWPCSTAAEMRLLCKYIVCHILSRHLGISGDNIHYFCEELETVIRYRFVDKKYSTGEENTLKILSGFDKLSHCLRHLKHLVLAVNSVVGISPVFRYTEPFPPPPHCFGSNRKIIKKQYTCKQAYPRLVEPIEVLVQLESSGKWPKDFEAQRRVKAALNIELGNLLGKMNDYKTKVHADYVDVLCNGYVFRIIVFNRHEVAALITIEENGVIKYRDTEESRNLRMKMVFLPQITAILHSFQMFNDSYGVTCQLVKRWISGQLLYGYISELVVDLIVAYLYLEPQPFAPPSCPQIGFLRFLRLVSKFDWRNSPMIVNFNNTLSKDVITEINEKFLTSRMELPAMFIATPQEYFTSSWTKSNPTKPILNRLILLAKEAYKVFEAQLTSPAKGFDYEAIFRPPLEPYDVLIHLDLTYVINRRRDVENGGCKKTLKSKSVMPIVNFSPVTAYLESLREVFGDYALFFYDYYGGSYIAVIWKPSTFECQPFKMLNMSCRMFSSRTSNAILNIPAILEDFLKMGKGLAALVEPITDRTKISLN